MFITMKTYGLILADNRSNCYFQGTADTRWTYNQVDQLKDIPSKRFREGRRIVSDGLRELRSGAPAWDWYKAASRYYNPRVGRVSGWWRDIEAWSQAHLRAWSVLVAGWIASICFLVNNFYGSESVGTNATQALACGIAAGETNYLATRFKRARRLRLRQSR
jgi:hypothetical protein